MKEVEVRILNRREDMPIATGMLSQFATENGLSPAVLHDLNVVLDEALNNIIAYGYDEGEPDEIKVRLECRNEAVAMVIEDQGRPFDPRGIPTPDLTASLRTRKVGGLGVHFMQALMDDIAYTRTAGTNRLCLTKKLTI